MGIFNKKPDYTENNANLRNDLLRQDPNREDENAIKRDDNTFGDLTTKVVSFEEKRRKMIQVNSKSKLEDQIWVFRKSFFSKGLLIFFIVAGIFTVLSFVGRDVVTGLVTLAQTVLFGLAWFIGMGFLKVKFHAIYWFLSFAGFALIIVYAIIVARPY